MSSRPTASVSKRVSKMPADPARNLNHLLNFTLPPRETRMTSTAPRRSRKVGSGLGVRNKERFVNAQYRFVMDPSGDYTVHFADPDIFFQWQDILQVIIPRSSALASALAGGYLSTQDEGNTLCPICLSPPTAPRLTKCGHVFCFPCILHYLGTSDNKWARCPVCFDSVNESHLKSVKWYDGQLRMSDANVPSSGASSSSGSSVDDPDISLAKAGSILRMRLIQRAKISTLALPRSHTWPSNLLPLHQAPFHFLPDVFTFAKFMLATPAYLVEQLSKELLDLDKERRILSALEDVLGVMFVDNAKAKVRTQIAKAEALSKPSLINNVEKLQREFQELNSRQALAAYHHPIADVPEVFLAQKSGGQGTSITHDVRAPVKAVKSGPRHRKNINPPPPSTSTYYYYQAASGLPVFLHPLDIKILLSYFSNYSSFPDSITVRVESLVESTVDDELRKRCKYLAHLPIGADVVFIEADLEGVVGRDALKGFDMPLRMRATRRKEKIRKEDRARVKGEEKERQKENMAMRWRDNKVSTQESLIPDGPAEEFWAMTGVSQVSTPPVPSWASTSGQRAPLGAWDVRSYASALHSSPTECKTASASHSARRRPPEEEFNMDEVWRELEQLLRGGRNTRR